MMNKKGQEAAWGTLIFVIAFILLGMLLLGYQFAKPFIAQQSGKAELAQAEQNRQIQILEAKAANEAATSRAEAQVKIAEAEAASEIARAKGVAEANRIIGESLRGNNEYLTYLWVQGLHDGNTETIYVPTEANIPLLEATRRG